MADWVASHFKGGMCPEIWMAKPSFCSSSYPIKKWSAMSTLSVYYGYRRGIPLVLCLFSLTPFLGLLPYNHFAYLLVFFIFFIFYFHALGFGFSFLSFTLLFVMCFFFGGVPPVLMNMFPTKNKDVKLINGEVDVHDMYNSLVSE